MIRPVARISFTSAMLTVMLALVVAITPVLADVVIKNPVAGTNKQAYGRFYHSQVEPLCSYQNSKFDVVVLAEYTYVKGQSRILIQRFWVTVYNFTGSTFVHYAIVEDSDGHTFGRFDNIMSVVQNGGSHTWAFDIQPDRWFHGDTAVTVKTRHGPSPGSEYCGEQDSLAFSLP